MSNISLNYYTQTPTLLSKTLPVSPHWRYSKRVLIKENWPEFYNVTDKSTTIVCGILVLQMNLRHLVCPETDMIWYNPEVLLVLMILTKVHGRWPSFIYNWSSKDTQLKILYERPPMTLSSVVQNRDPRLLSVIIIMVFNSEIQGFALSIFDPIKLSHYQTFRRNLYTESQSEFPTNYRFPVFFFTLEGRYSFTFLYQRLNCRNQYKFLVVALFCKPTLSPRHNGSHKDVWIDVSISQVKA